MRGRLGWALALLVAAPSAVLLPAATPGEVSERFVPFAGADTAATSLLVLAGVSLALAPSSRPALHVIAGATSVLAAPFYVSGYISNFGRSAFTGAPDPATLAVAVAMAISTLALMWVLAFSVLRAVAVLRRVRRV